MKVPSIVADMGKAVMPVLIDEAVEQIGKSASKHLPTIEVDGKQYLSKDAMDKVGLVMSIIRRVYQAYLVLAGKAEVVQFAEDYKPLKQAAREAVKAVKG